MGTIRGWKKVIDDREHTIWHKISPHGGVDKNKFVIVGLLKRSYYVHINTKREYKQVLLNNKKNAVKYAVKWMKSHPNG